MKSVSYEDLEFIVDEIHDANKVCFAETFYSISIDAIYRLNYHIWVKNVVGCILW